ncbi:hypothetical protein, partial [Devosia indica]
MNLFFLFFQWWGVFLVQTESKKKPKKTRKQEINAQKKGKKTSIRNHHMFHHFYISVQLRTRGLSPDGVWSGPYFVIYGDILWSFWGVFFFFWWRFLFGFLEGKG